MPGPSTSTFLTTTTTMTQTTPPTTVTAAATATTPATSVSRSSSAPATPGLTGAAQGAHPSSHFSVRKTSLPHHQVHPQPPTSSFHPASNTDRMLQAASSGQTNIISTQPPLQYVSASMPVSFTASTIPTTAPTTTSPTETTVGYTPAAMTVVTDPLTMGSITSGATPITIATTPSPPMHHVLPLQDMDEEFYLRHYSTNLIKPGMAPILESELFHTINDSILRHSRTTTHLQHVVLAFSAFHLASITPCPSTTHSHHLATALHYKALALENFRPALEAGITPENGEPLLATSIVLVACTFALPVADPIRQTGYNHIDLLAESMGLFQGTSAILRQGVYRDLSPEQHSLPGTSNLPSSGGEAPLAEWERSMSILHCTIEAIDPASAEEQHRKSILLHAAGKLRRCVDQELITCLWLGMVKKDVSDLVSKRDPLALALVAHWAILSGNSPLSWWKSGWLETYMAAIQEVMSDEHHHLISWCFTRLG